MFKLQLCILVAGALGGRFDHEIGNINVLCCFPTMRMVLLTDDCLILLLPSTHRHEILIQSSVEGPHCGLIPIGMPSERTTTTGLKWNLCKYITVILITLFDVVMVVIQMTNLVSCHFSYFLLSLILILPVAADTEMRFGGLISTSNIVIGEIITVQSDSDLLWTISIKKP